MLQFKTFNFSNGKLSSSANPMSATISMLFLNSKTSISFEMFSHTIDSMNEDFWPFLEIYTFLLLSSFS